MGLESVDIGAATKNGVMVARIPSEESGNAASVAEHAILFLLMLSRRWNEILKTRKHGARVVWGSPAGQALLGKTVCVVGLGGVGRELARRLAGFKVRIVTVDDHPGRTVPGVDIVPAPSPFPGSAKQSGRPITWCSASTTPRTGSTSSV